MYECMYVCTFKYTCLSKRTNQMPFREQSHINKAKLAFRISCNLPHRWLWHDPAAHPITMTIIPTVITILRLQPDGAHSLTAGTALKQLTPSLIIIWADNCGTRFTSLCAFKCVKYRQYACTGATVHESERRSPAFGNESVFAVPSEGP